MCVVITVAANGGLEVKVSGEYRVLIIGGGFGGLHAAKALCHAPVSVTLLDKKNYHLFQPLLYQVATGALSPANIAAPLRAVLKSQKNTTVLMAEVTGFDVADKRVLFKSGGMSYDSLIVAAGVGHSYFGNDAWAPLAPGLKSIEEATEIRKRFLLAFEEAERETDPEKVKALLTFVIIGGGPTGVELAGAIKEVAVHTLFDNFRTIHPTDTRVILVEHAERLLPPFPPALSEESKRALERLGVEVRVGAKVTSVQQGEVEIQSAGGTEKVRTETVLWAAGVGATPVARALAQATGAETDRAGRILVEPDLSLKGYPDIYVIGDMMSLKGEDGKPLPGVAQVAVQQGRCAARNIARRLAGEEPQAFHYRDLGSLATIGRAAAVASIGGFQFSGLIAWLIWLFVHLMHLVQFQNRLLVLLQWSWSYFTWNRAARLITGNIET